MPQTRIRNNSFLYPNMTRHYTVEITETTAKLKLTYRNGKFKRLEHLSGKINDSTIKEIGRIIPPKENDLEAFKQSFEGKINYTAEVKEKTLLTEFKDEWAAFHLQFRNFPAKINGAEINALKQIEKYLVEVSDNNKELALDSWKFILNNWKSLDAFHQKNTTLLYVNSKLTIIIANLGENLQKSTQGSHVSAMQRANSVADNLFK